MYSLTIPFLLGQLGLFLVAACGIGIIHALSENEENPPPWIYVVSLWGGSIYAAFLLTSPYVYGPENIPEKAYIFRFLIGVHYLIVFVVTQFIQRPTPAPRLLLRANGPVGLLLLAVLLSVAGMTMFGRDTDDATALERQFFAFGRRIQTQVADSSYTRSQQILTNREVLYQNQRLIRENKQLTHDNQQLLLTIRNMVARIVRLTEAILRRTPAPRANYRPIVPSAPKVDTGKPLSPNRVNAAVLQNAAFHQSVAHQNK